MFLPVEKNILILMINTLINVREQYDLWDDPQYPGQPRHTDPNQKSSQTQSFVRSQASAMKSDHHTGRASGAESEAT